MRTNYFALIMPRAWHNIHSVIASPDLSERSNLISNRHLKDRHVARAPCERQLCVIAKQPKADEAISSSLALHGVLAHRKGNVVLSKALKQFLNIYAEINVAKK